MARGLSSHNGLVDISGVTVFRRTLRMADVHIWKGGRIGAIMTRSFHAHLHVAVLAFTSVTYKRAFLISM
jgi:hypothetical protein